MKGNQVMNEQIYNYLGDKINECIFEFLGTTEGGLSPTHSLEMEHLQIELAELIEKIIDYNKKGY